MTQNDSAARSTEHQRSLADYCEWLPDGGRQPYYAPAPLVLVRQPQEGALSVQERRAETPLHIPTYHV